MDFLLECIGFPPDYDHAELIDLFDRLGEAAPWRDREGRQRRLALGNGLEIRLADRELEGGPEVWPFFTAADSLRLEVDRLERLPDSPLDALLHGWANPAGARSTEVSARFRFSTWLVDRRRLPATLRRGRVLAVSVAGYALDVRTVTPTALRPRIEPLGGPEDPGGCVDLTLQVLDVELLENPVTGAHVQRLELDAPGRPLTVFISPWQLEEYQLELPTPGVTIRGTFLFNGRVAGGLPTSTRRLGRSFG
ncbi:MAG: hypothetical protein AAFZ65_10390 [Planctomycetota bacterium]